jgi:SnoaL-like domain
VKHPGRTSCDDAPVNSEETRNMDTISQNSGRNDAIAAAERVYKAWDEALGRKDIDAAVSLYAENIVLESPLVRHLLGSEEGIVHGWPALRAFVERVFARQPALRQRYREGFFTDGRRLMWEYPRVTDSGEQIDLVEVMDIADGLITRHRVYWGWFGVKLLEENRHHAD